MLRKIAFLKNQLFPKCSFSEKVDTAKVPALKSQFFFRYLYPRQVRGACVRCAGSRCQIPGSRCAGVRCQMPGFRCQVPGPMCHASGIRDQIAREYVSDLRDQVPRENVENIHTKNILRLNGNYKLILFSTEITNIQTNFSPRQCFLQHVSEKTTRKTQLPAMAFQVFFQVLGHKCGRANL